MSDYILGQPADPKKMMVSLTWELQGALMCFIYEKLADGSHRIILPNSLANKISAAQYAVIDAEAKFISKAYDPFNSTTAIQVLTAFKETVKKWTAST